MPSNKATILWFVNVISFILFVVLTVTGLINWLAAPGGCGGGDGPVFFRHLFREIHEWTAVLFIIAMAVHMMLHWSYIRVNLKKYGIDI
ncbi:MAG: DUF4405 domain-containing protein [Desulfosalsimonadaceae bacterium]